MTPDARAATLMDFGDFEERAEQEPDLQLSCLYWNHLLPEVSGASLWLLFLWPQFRDYASKVTSSNKKKESRRCK